ncbi:MAG: gamma-glutamyltransferase family protein, partial [Planctomycetota bacterium]
EELRRLMYRRMPLFTGHAVTVPGAVAAWCDLLERHGSMPLAEVLAPAVRIAEEGYPVTKWIAASWARTVEKLKRAPGWESGDIYNGPPQESGNELLLDGRAPRVGETMRLPTLARTLRAVAESGRDAIYRGDFARRLSEHVERYGGWITPEDLAAHRSEWVEPITAEYRGVILHECPPNGQGLAAILAVLLADGFDLEAADEADRHHLLVECMRLAFADALRWVADPGERIPLATLLDPEYTKRRRARIDADRAARFVPPGLTAAGSDTVYLTVVDGEGNAASFIQSLFMGTGTGLVVPGTGVSLQNRGAGFTLEEGHPNVLAPGKRPYHTIIPALTTRGGELHSSFGVMGGPMQPQGHLQVLSHLLDRGSSPQEALDEPRWQLAAQRKRRGFPDPEGALLVEEGFDAGVVDGLANRGHEVRMVGGFDRVAFGGGQVILRDPETGVLTGGSDPRKDGRAVGF